MSTISPVGAGAATLQYQPVNQVDNPTAPQEQSAPTLEQNQAASKTLESQGAVSVDISETAQAQMQSTVRPVEANNTADTGTLKADSTPVPQTEFDVGLLALDKANEVPQTLLSVMESAGDPILQFEEK